MASKTVKKSSSNSRNAGSSKSGNSRSGNSKSNNSPTSRSGSRNASSPASNGRSSGSRSSAKSNSSAGSSRKQPKNLMLKLFTDSLKDIYWAEKHLMKALKMMSREATSEELKECFEEHRMVTEQQIERLDQVFEMLGMRAQGKKCEAMEGLVKEVESVLEETEDDTMTRDAALIMGAQKAEHYEIATYGTLATIAKAMGYEEIGELLGETLEEEKQTDELLTSIAESSINMQAMNESEEEEE